jgi:hypothetical protein
MPTYYSAFQSVASDASYHGKSRRYSNDERDDTIYGEIWSREWLHDNIHENIGSKKNYFQVQKDYESKLLEENAALKFQLSLARTEIEHLQNSKQHGATLFCSLAPKKYAKIKSDQSAYGVESDAQTVRMGSSSKDSKLKKRSSHLDRGLDYTNSCVRSFIYGKRFNKPTEEVATAQRTGKRPWKSKTNKVREEERDDLLNVSSGVNFSKKKAFNRQTLDKIKSVENFRMKSGTHNSTLYHDHEEVEVTNSHLPVIHESLHDVFDVDDKVEI